MRSITRTLTAYRRGVDAYLAQWGRRRYRVPPLLRDLTRALAPGASVLDVGCGPAQDTTYLASRGFHATGFDALPEFLLWARTRDQTLCLVQGTFLALPFRPSSFGATWAAASLIHAPKRDVRFALRALRTITQPGGLLAATFVHGTASGVLTHGWLPGRYLSRWTKDELAAVVRRAGWTIDSLTTVANRERKGRWLNVLAHTEG